MDDEILRPAIKESGALARADVSKQQLVGKEQFDRCSTMSDEVRAYNKDGCCEGLQF